MIKSIYKGLPALVLAIVLGCGCAADMDDLSTNSQEEDEIVHKQSTLSTEKSTNVDNTEESSAEMLTTDAVESASESPEATAEIVYITKEEVQEPSSADEHEREPQTEEETRDAYMEELLSDAAYYYTFYAPVYRTLDEDTALAFDEETFLTAYECIEQEALSDYFSDISWLTREDGISLSFTPTQLLFPEGNENSYLWMARCIHAFALTTEAYSADANWDHPDSLKPQFHCHAIYARQNKVPWNIEPYRTETSFLKIILAMGNPD